MKELCKSYERLRHVISRESQHETYRDFTIYACHNYDTQTKETYNHCFKVYGDSYYVTFPTIEQAHEHIDERLA